MKSICVVLHDSTLIVMIVIDSHWELYNDTRHNISWYCLRLDAIQRFQSIGTGRNGKDLKSVID